MPALALPKIRVPHPVAAAIPLSPGREPGRRWRRLAGRVVATALLWPPAFRAANDARISTTLAPDAGRLVIEAQGLPPPAPVFFTASAEQVFRVAASGITGESRLKVRILQGRPEALSLGLSGEGEVTTVTGGGLRDWAVRQDAAAGAGKRFLVLRLAAAGTAPPAELDLLVQTRMADLPSAGPRVLPLLTAGEAVGFSATIELRAEPGVEPRVTAAAGVLATAEARRFVASGDSRLELQVAARGAVLAEAELVAARLVGRVDEASRSVGFTLEGTLRAQTAGARVPLLGGAAAPTRLPVSEAWHVELRRRDDGFAYEIVADKAGSWPVALEFAAALRSDGDWRALDFAMPGAAVVPLQLEGLGDEVVFKSDAAVVPARDGNAWRGFLPAGGGATLAWKHRPVAAATALAFVSAEQADVRVGAGRLRQRSLVSFRVLQGSLPGLRLRLHGPGEIAGVTGENVVGWTVAPAADGGRVLEVRLSRPVEAQAAFVVESQAELGAWPVRAEPLRLTPEGGVRHSGHLRVANSGAVRVEVVDAAGLMQLAPAQWPGEADPSARQAFVFRFPSASYSYRVLAAAVQPEVGVAAIATYELGETARAIQATLELDVREAALRDFTFRIPEGHTVVSLTGAGVADHVVEAADAAGGRTVRVLFGGPVEGRQLLQVRLEASQPAAAGEWRLAPLQFPTAKTVRGHVGVVAAPGFRLVPARVERLVEVPLSTFPRTAAGLQHAWRLREADWAAELRIEALGQSVQADVFHLATLKEGVVAHSVLLNYFVVGAPVGEWRVEVPAGVGNLDVVGQNVRPDWRREGDQVVVHLHQPVLGAATLLLTFEQPMSARGGVIQPGAVRPVGVQAERGFVQVVSPLQVKHEVRRAEGALLLLEPAELPAEFRTFTSAPSLATFQYTGRPFALELAIEWHAAGELVEQVVDFARLATQVARDGQVVTEAQFFVKTRGRKPLRLVLPENVRLWEARVDHEVVSARADGGHTLVPLPARTSPNEPALVVLRLGQPAGDGTVVRLAAPRVADAPTVVTEWTVRPDAGRVLVPRAGGAELLAPALTETGFEWIGARASGATLGVLALGACAAWLLRGASGARIVLGLAVGAVASGGTLLLAGRALVERRPNAAELTFAAPVVPAGETVALVVENLPEWRALLVPWGVAVFAAGVFLLVAADRVRRSHGRLAGLLPVPAAVLVTLGSLAQHRGAVVFFALLGLGWFTRLFLPAFAEWRRERRREEAGGGGAGATAVTLLAFVTGAVLLSAGGGELRAAAAPERTAQEIVQRWTWRGERLVAEAEVMLRGGTGDSFLVLRSPAVLTAVSGDGVRVNRVAGDYFLVLERAGNVAARLRFELAVADRTKPIAVPTGLAAAQRVTIDLDQPGWEFSSPQAVQVSPVADPEGKRSGAVLVLAPGAAATVQLQPRRRDAGAESTQYFAESVQLYLPGPGVVNGVARITIRPVQGQVSALELELPAGFTAGEAARGPVGAWRFDPATRRLQVAIEPAQTGAFQFDVETQLGTGDLPFALGLEPLRVRGAAGHAGLVGLAFAGDAQPEGVRADGLTAVSVEDFPADLLPRGRDRQPLAALQHVWRHGPEGGRVELTVAPVAPEVRVASRQVFSLDDDRLVVSADLRVTIARVGVFKLSFALPEGLEVEALSGAALGQWTEALEGGQRIVTLHLKGRTLGEQAFHLALAGAAPPPQEAWPLPRLRLREAARQSAEALVVPGKGLRLRATERERVTQLDPRGVGGMQPGTLAFRLLEADWVLRLGLEALEPWVTVQALQEVTAREGQTLTRIGARFRVENAAVKLLQARLAGISAEAARTVRAAGPAVSDIVRLPAAAGEPDDRWEIRFRRSIAGEAEVQVEFQDTAERLAGETITVPEFVGVRQATLFVAVRGGGRLELAAPDLPRGWRRADWSAVPAILQSRTDRSVPALCFRVAEPEGPLVVSVKRHAVAEALKLRATRAELLTILAPEGPFLTAVDLQVDVLEKGTLRVRLPAGARLFNALVNGESVAAVRDGEAWLFHVGPKSPGERAAGVRMVYAARLASGHDVGLLAPSLSVPLENVAWRVVLPPGYELDGYHGPLRLRDERAGGSFSVSDYQEFVKSKRSNEAKQAVALLQEANALLARGEQDKAGEALSRASNQLALDEASNEDARVQLRNLKTQQAVLGLNTRRQRMYFDHKAEAVRNDPLEQAASLNPFMQGRVNFDPRQVDQLLLGNTSDENAALRGIAAKMVDQQLGAQPAPGVLDVTLPERGRVLTFTRSLQVDGGAPMELRLGVVRAARPNWTFNALLLLGIAGVVAVELRGRMVRATGA